MLALKIIDVKDFMNKLLIGEVFDRFFLVEASVTTFNVFTIDGRLQQDFFDTDTADSLKSKSIDYSLWRETLLFLRHPRQTHTFRIQDYFSAFQSSGSETTEWHRKQFYHSCL